MSTTKNPYRLDRSIVPSGYRIFITPDLESATFSGRVEIDIDVKESNTSFTLNAKALEMGDATITSGSTSLRSTNLTLNDKYETATFSFESALPTGAGVLEIAFTGVLNDHLQGFYLSKYKDASGTEHRIATTQFEHSYARQAFPCWDEPSFKATYQVNLTVPSHLAVYSNNPETSNVDLGNGQRTVAYSPTMVMSTYLVAFCVGPFESTAAVDVDGVPLRVIYPIGKGHLTDLAMEAGAHALRFFTSYFDIPYPGEKLDMIAIPDFAAGAMENLGLVTYRETALLVDPNVAGLAAVQRVAEVVAHEIAHMWFGDLVTMEWWEGIWLNEAFATFCATLAMEDFRPEWDIWTWFAVIDREMAMKVDGLHSTRPIEYEVISPDDTQGMFDVLTYEKGGGVLRMLQQFLGEETYRNGIRRYLKKHSYKNTVTTDLWDALEEESGKPVRDIMNTFILQGGHPMVTLENGQISQQPFAYGSLVATPTSPKSEIGKQWLVPVLTKSLDSTTVTRNLLSDKPITISDAAPVLVNVGASGVFRTRYGAAESSAIAARFGELEKVDRANILLDAWAALFAGQITWASFEELARSAAPYREVASLETVAAAIEMLNRVLTDEQRPKIAAFTNDIFAPVLDAFGWDPKPNENTFDGKARGLAIGTLGSVAKNHAVIAEARKRFDAGKIHGDILISVLRVIAEQSQTGDFDEFWKRCQNAATPQDENNYRMALGFFTDETLLLRATEMCYSTFRNQDGGMMLGFYSRNRVSGPAVWKVIAKRWDEAMERFPSSAHARLAVGVSTYVTDEAFSREVEKFHNEHPLAGRQKTVDQEIERMHVGIAFTKAMRSQF